MEPFDDIHFLITYFEGRIHYIELLEDLERSDLINLLRITSTVRFFHMKEEELLSQNKCPKCGASIKETQTNACYDEDGIPTSIFLRVGCVDCDYELMNEVID